MKTQLKYFILLLLLGAGFTSATGQTETEIKDVLFVGNSFTYFYNMPHLVEAMAKLEGLPINTVRSTIGGSNLSQHVKGENNTQTQKLLKDGSWDVVILQEFSNGTITNLDRFNASATTLVQQARDKGAKALLYNTWSYAGNPLMQTAIDKAYIDLGKKLNVGVVPVGDIFMKARTLRPDLDMYFDNKHQSANGSYLIALVFYKYLTGKSVLNIPDRLETKDASGEDLYLCFIHPDTGDFLRQLVEEYDMSSFNLLQE